MKFCYKDLFYANRGLKVSELRAISNGRSTNFACTIASFLSNHLTCPLLIIFTAPIPCSVRSAGWAEVNYSSCQQTIILYNSTGPLSRKLNARTSESIGSGTGPVMMMLSQSKLQRVDRTLVSSACTSASATRRLGRGCTLADAAGSKLSSHPT